MKQVAHETYLDDEVSQSSDRAFGLVMAAAFGVVSTLNAWRHGSVWPWTSALAVMLLLAAWLAPSWLGPPKRLWLRLGLLMHRVVNPVVMALLFYGALLPTALVVRMRGGDPLRLNRDPDADSYWIARVPPGPAPDTMKDQF